MLEKATDIVFFDDDAAIIEAQDSIDTLYIIIKGMVKEIDASGEILALYHPSDSFDTRALFEQSYRHSFIAVEQSLRYAQNHHPYAHRRKQRIWCLLFCQYC